jgi:hypothetical protein
LPGDSLCGVSDVDASPLFIFSHERLEKVLESLEVALGKGKFIDWIKLVGDWLSKRME